MADSNREADNASEISSFSDSSDEGKKEVEIVEEAIEEIDKPVYTDEDLDTLIGFIRNMIFLFDYDEEDFNDDVVEIIKLWLTDANYPLLFIFYDGDILSASLGFPLCPFNDLMYFMRDPDQLFNVIRFHDDIMFGTLQSDIEGSLLVILEQVYGPLILSTELSENVKANVLSGYNTFMTYLTELHYKLSGFTLLYVPREGIDMDVQEVVLNRSMIKRLESVVIDWTSQIRSTLSDTQHFVPDNLICPTDEYSFWLYRHEVLSAIKTQFQNPNVEHILQILNLAQSLYTKPLREVLSDLEKEIVIAESNIPFLKLLVDPCFAIRTLNDEDDLCSQLIYVMHIIRFIGVDSSHLSRDECITKLFLYLSNEIVSCCVQSIDINKILMGSPGYGIEICNLKINCCESYKIIYEEMLEHFKKEYSWNLDYATIFNQINAFIQRLCDILEICEAMLIFGRYSGSSSYKNFRFPCNNAHEYEQKCDQVMMIFTKGIESIQSSAGTVLDINNKEWYKTIAEFRDMLRNLDDVIENLLSNIFLVAENLEEKIDVLVTLLNFYNRNSIKESYMRKIAEIWKIFHTELTSISKEVSSGINIHPTLLPTKSGQYTMLKIKFERLCRLKDLLERCRFFPTFNESEDTLSLFESCEKQVKLALKKFNESWTRSLSPDFGAWFHRNLICRSQIRSGLLECHIEREMLNIFNEAHFFKVLGATIPSVIDLDKNDTTRHTFDSVIRVVLYFNSVVSSISEKERLFFKPMIQQTERKLEPLRSKLTWDDDLNEYIDTFVTNVKELLDMIQIYKRENFKISRSMETIYNLELFKLNKAPNQQLNEMFKNIGEQKKESLSKLVGVYTDISKNIFHIYDQLGSNLRRMGESWIQYVRKIDRLLQAAVYNSSLITLKNMEKALTEPHHPILSIEIVLDKTGVAYQPTLAHVEVMLKRLTAEVTTTIKIIPTLCQKFQIDAGENIYEAFLTDDRYLNEERKIKTSINNTLENLVAFKEKWNVFRPFWSVNRVSFIEKFKLASMTSEAFQKNIEKFDELLNQLTTQSELTVCECVHIDAQKLKYAITNHIHDWQSKYIEYLKCVSYGLIIDFNNKLNQNMQSMSIVPIEVEDLKELEETFKNCFDDIPRMIMSIDNIVGYFDVLEKYVSDILPEALNLRKNIHGIWKRYMEYVNAIKEKIGDYQNQFKLSMTNEAACLKVNALEMLKMLDDDMPTTDDILPEEAFLMIDSLLEKLEILKSQERIIAAKMKLLGIEYHPLDVITEISRKLESIKSIWVFVETWLQIKQQILARSYNTVIVDSLHNDIVQIRSDFANLENSLLPDMHYPIYTNTSTEVVDFCKTMDITIDMKQSHLRDRHWMAVQEITEMPKDNQENLLLRDLMEFRYFKYENDFKRLCNSARREFDIETKIKNVERNAAHLRIIVKQNATGTYTIVNSDEMVYTVKQNLLTIDGIITSVHRKPFLDEIYYWEETLNFMIDLHEVLQVIVEKIQTIIEIFAVTKFSSSMTDFNRAFLVCIEQWKNMVNYITSSNLRKDICVKGTEVLQNLDDIQKEIERIFLMLKQTMNEKRLICSRLNLVPDNLLIKMIAFPTNLQYLQSALSYMFENVKTINIRKPELAEKQPSMEVAGIQLNADEVIAFIQPIIIDSISTSEHVINSIEASIQQALKKDLQKCLYELKESFFRRVESGWMDSYCYQVCLKSIQIDTTHLIKNAIIQCDLLKKDKPMRMLRTLHNRLLNDLAKSNQKFAEQTRKPIFKKKLNAMIVMEINTRDVIGKLTASKVKSGLNNFEWLSHIRSYWSNESLNCIVAHLNNKFYYGFESKTSDDPLFITPYTNRLLMTISSALKYEFIPYLTGNDEKPTLNILKHFSTEIAVLFVIFSCDHRWKLDTILRCFDGIVKLKSWLCFSGIDNIPSHVLTRIKENLGEYEKKINVLDLKKSKVMTSFQLFVTSSKLTSRIELDRAIIRSVEVTSPDQEILLQNILWIIGFRKPRRMANLINSFTIHVAKYLPNLAFLWTIKRIQQAIMNIKYAIESSVQEEALLISRVLQNDFYPCLSDENKQIFDKCIQNIFKDMLPTSPANPEDDLKLLFSAEKLTHSEPFEATLRSIIEALSLPRQPLIVLGDPFSGKSTLLDLALQAISRDGSSIQKYVLNPESIHGFQSESTIEDILATIVASPSHPRKCIIFDSVARSDWIERLGSIEEYLNGDLERLCFENVEAKIVVETCELSNVTPASLVNFSIVHVDTETVSWRHIFESWIDRQAFLTENIKSNLQELADDFIDVYLKSIKRSNFARNSDANLIKSFCSLYETISTSWINDEATFTSMHWENAFKRLFFFCCVWSIGANFDSSERGKFDVLVREGITDVMISFPLKGNIYQYFIEVAENSSSWIFWNESHLNTNISGSFINSIDNIPYQFITKCMISKQTPVLLTSIDVVGKSSMIKHMLDGMLVENQTTCVTNLNTKTISKRLREILEWNTMKVSKEIVYPKDRKNMLWFLDDLHSVLSTKMDAAEFLRHVIEHTAWIDNNHPQRLKQTQILAAMRNTYPLNALPSSAARLLNKFHIISYNACSDESNATIFSCKMMRKNQSSESNKFIDILAPATIALVCSLATQLPATPIKPRYQFSLKTVDRILSSMCTLNPNICRYEKNVLLKLWIHECFRETWDLLDKVDHKVYYEILNDNVSTHFEATLHSLCPGNKSPLFCDVMNPEDNYEDVTEINQLMQFAEEAINLTPESKTIVYREAIEHAAKLFRIIRIPKGHLVLIGESGSGRQTTCDLAARILNHKASAKGSQTVVEIFETIYLPLCFATNESVDIVDNKIEHIFNLASTHCVICLIELDDTNKMNHLLLEFLDSFIVNSSISGFLKSSKFKDDGIPATIFNNLHFVLCLPMNIELYRNLLNTFPSLLTQTSTSCIHPPTEISLMEIAKKFFKKHIAFDVPISPQENIKTDSTQHRKRDSLVQSTEDRFHNSSVDAMARTHTTILREGLENDTLTSWFFELLLTFQRVLMYKRGVLRILHEKFSKGINKIMEATQNVKTLQDLLEQQQQQIETYQRELETFIENIESQTIEADEQKQQVAEQRVKIGAEEVICKNLADIAEADLAKAMPALNSAIAALDSLNKKDMNEIKSYARPPVKVELVLNAVMILLGKEPTWAESKRQLGEQKFLDTLRNFDKNNITEKTLKIIGGYARNPELEPNKVGIVSKAAKSLILWVRAIENYGKVYKYVGPKIKKMEDANASLLEKQMSLKAAEQKLADLAKKLAELREEYELKMKSKQELEEKARQMALKLQRATSLVQGLSSEKLRWTKTKQQLENQHHNLIGDVFLASGSLVYFGSISAILRENIRMQWMIDLEALEIPFNKKFNLFEFFYQANDLQKWQQNGLPTDSLSFENATILLQCKFRIPLIIDPQGEIRQWIIGIHNTDNLSLYDINEDISSYTVDLASQLNNKIVLYNFQENSMPIVIKFLHNLFKVKYDSCDINSEIRCLSKALDHVSMSFLSSENIAYRDALRKKTNMINFVLGLSGLETKLLTIVVEHENPNLEERKEILMQTIIDNNKILFDLEETILRLLNESNMPLLENEELYSTLQVSKQTTDRVNMALDQDERTRQEIESSRESYRPCAERSCLLFFVIESMRRLNPMYAFSLDWYFTLFKSSLKKCPRSQMIEERTKKIIDFHTLNVFKNVCFGLKPLDRNIFGFLLCVRLLFADERMSSKEYNFLLHGPGKIDRIEQIENPSPNWISSEQWDNITELDKLPGFLGIAQSFEESNAEWNHWYKSPCPEAEKMPANWEKNLTLFQKNMVVRSLRLDRFEPCMINYVDINLGKKYTYTDRTSLLDMLAESSAQTPILLVTDSNNNPWSEVQLLAKTNSNNGDVKSLNMNSDSLQDFAYFLKQCVSEESWLFVNNFQKMKSFIVKFPTVLKYLKSIDSKSRFRLWLSASENDSIPLIFLQSCIKFAYHKPIGIQQNMNMLFEEIGEREFEKLAKIAYHTQHKKLTFSLSFLHSLLNGRGKFSTLGWLQSYSFELSDFYLARKLLTYSMKDLIPVSKSKNQGNVMTESLSEIIPAEFIEKVCLEIGYGSKFTNCWDRRIYDSYCNEIFHQQFLDISRNSLTSFDHRFGFPRDGNFHAYKNFILKQIPTHDGIHVFALNENANIQHLQSKSSYILHMLRKISLDPQSSYSTDQIRTSIGMDYENVKQTIQELLTKLPVCLDYDNALRIVGANRTPVSDSLLLEICSYNEIVRLVRRNLEQTFAILLGERCMDEEYGAFLENLRQNRVPQAWRQRYPTNKCLSDWIADLKCRVEYFRKWSETGQLSTNVTLGYFIKPALFLSSVLQLYARANDISLTDTDWSVTVFATTKPIVKFSIEEGFIARDMYLHNGGWDLEKQCLKEPSILQMSSPMPPIHFKPVIRRGDVNDLDFLCPCYYGVNRTNESFICALYLKTGESQKDKWIQYNTAMSLTN